MPWRSRSANIGAVLRRPLALALAALPLSLACAWWAWAGDQRPTPVAHLLAFAVASAGFLLGLWGARGVGPPILRAALGLAVLWRLALVSGPPLLSDDVYRYVWEGRLQAHGGNPYAWPDRPESERFTALRDEVWQGVNHKGYTALYPPLWQLAARGVVALHDSVAAMKLFLVACELACWGLLAGLLRRRGQPPERLLLWAWNPAALVEVAGSGHNEPFGLLFVTLALLALELPRRAGAAAALVAGTLAKVVPVVLAVAWLRRLRLRDLALSGLAGLLLYVPYLDARQGLFRTLAAYGDSWRFNQTVFAALEAAAGTAAPGLAAALLLAVLALLAARVTDAVRAGALAVAAWLLLSPSVLPWYALWLLPFAVLGAGAWTTTFSLSSALAYLVYVGYTSGGAWQVGWGLRLVEYGLPLAVVIVEYRRARTRP